MNLRIAVILILLISFKTTSLLGSLELYSSQASISHTEGKGIGYTRGFTTFEFLLMGALQNCPPLFPFIDIRGHGFDDLKLAANVGIGLRYLLPSMWILGGNLYYDNRQGSHRFFDQAGDSYQQIGVGVEALSPRLDLRFNYYQPFGDKVKRFTQVSFKDHLGITPIITRKRQSMMKGADAEIGTCVGRWKIFCDYDWNLYASAGAYFLDPHQGRKRFGGKALLSATIARYFYLEARGYYDRVDRGIVQGRIGINFPLFPHASEKSKSCHHRWEASDRWLTLGEMVSQPPVRAEIIPLSSHTFKR